VARLGTFRDRWLKSAFRPTAAGIQTPLKRNAGARELDLEPVLDRECLELLADRHGAGRAVDERLEHGGDLAGINKRMRQFGKVDIRQEAFIAALKVDV